MQQTDFVRIQERFERYVARFYDLDPDGLRNIHLKRDHTMRVVSCMEEIAAGERLSEQERLVACVIALLHDLGRFIQYRRWRTFRDSESDNHARLSLEVIRSENMLEELSAEERVLIEEGVRFHNLLKLPERYSSPTDLYIRLIRDADKLDIWQVFLEFYALPEEERASAVGLGFPDLPEVTPACIGSLLAGDVVRLEDARVLNDFKLLQISWVYDLNFRSTCQLLQQRAYLERLAATLPAGEDITAAIDLAKSHVAREAASHR